MIINPKFKHGDQVKLRVSDDDQKGTVIGMTVTPSMAILYDITWGDRQTSPHYDIELALLAVAENDFVNSN